MTDATGATEYAYVSDRVAEQHGAKAHLFKYDHAGRLVSRRPTGDNTSTAETEGYAWDVQDQLRKVRARVGGVSQVVEVIDYDPTGLPLFRRVGSVGTWYVGKMATVTATVSSSCGGAAACAPLDTPKVAVHQLLDGNRIATVRPPALASTAGAFDEVLYYHRDYQGSVIGTSRRGAGVDGLAGAKYRYTPYGQLDRVEGVTAWTDSELGYTGGLRLGWVAGAVTSLATPQAPGLVLLGARVYHAELKRWLVPDTVDPLRYTYTDGDPVNRIDPSGRIWLEYGKYFKAPPKAIVNEDLGLMGFAQSGTWRNSGGNGSVSGGGQSSEAANGAGDQGPTLTPPAWIQRSPAPLQATEEQYSSVRLLDVTLKVDPAVYAFPVSGKATETSGFHYQGQTACCSISGTGQAHGSGHQQVDLRSRTGSLVFSMTNGQVVTSTRNAAGFPGLVEIHGDDGLTRQYGHNWPLVEKGQRVFAGAPIGVSHQLLDAEGTDHAHLHFAVFMQLRIGQGAYHLYQDAGPRRYLNPEAWLLPLRPSMVPRCP